jgi:DNA-binding CsgD family transcriptional regulator
VATPVPTAELIGRTSERDRLRVLLDGAAAGIPGVVVLTGEAGVGKTRLVESAVADAREDGWTSAIGACFMLSGTEHPFAALTAALRRHVEDDALPALGATARRELARLFPTADIPAAEPGEPADFSRARLFEILLAVVRGLPTEQPALLVLEDLHWADPSTLDFIGFVVHNLTDERLAVLLTFRTDELARGHRTAETVAELRRSARVTVVDVDRLGLAETTRHIATLVGHEPAPELAVELHRRTGGNPLFVEELVAAHRSGDDALPATVRDTVLVRVERQPEDVQELLRAMAIVRRPAEPELLARVVGGDAADVARRIRAATATHLLTVRPDSGRVAFRHALLGEALRAELLSHERRALHERVATALAGLDGGTFAELAGHWRGAGRLREALLASAAASRAAMGMYAYGEAYEHLRTALALWPEAGKAAGVDRLALLAMAADVARLDARHEDTARLCQQALAAIDETQTPELAAEFHERLGRARYFDQAAAARAFGAALALLAPEPPTAIRARLLAAQAQSLLFEAQHGEARDRAEHAMAAARAAGAPTEENAARLTLGMAHAFLGDTAAAGVLLAQARAAATGLADPEQIGSASIYLGELHRLEGHPRAALEVMLEGRREVAPFGLEATKGTFMAAQAAQDAFRIGDWQRCDELLASLDAAAVSTTTRLTIDTVAGRLAAARGDLDAARAHLVGAHGQCSEGPLAEFLPGVVCGLLDLAVRAGDPAAARATVDRAIDAVHGREDVLNTPLLYTRAASLEADLAERARAGRDDAGAAEAAERAERLVARLRALLAGAEPAALPADARVYRAQASAELARARGQAEPAVWAAVAERWERLDHPLGAAAAWLRASEAALAGNDRPSAQAAVGAAHALATRVGATLLAGEIQALAQRARLALDRSAPAATPAAGLGLTSRETEVLGLVAEGLTNREIAQRLFIAPKTASLHVSHILQKLGVHNRVEASGVAHRLRLGHPPTDPETSTRTETVP